MDNIIKVKFSEGQETQFDNSLKQWNFGQTLQVEGVAIPDGEVEVHYSLTENCGNASVFVGTVKNNVITVKIPNFLLTKENVYQSTYEAYAWIYLTDEESGQTMRKIVFTVESRAKPDDYIYTEEEKREYDKLKEEVENISAKQKSLQKEVDELPIENGTGKNALKSGNIDENVASGENAISNGDRTQATGKQSFALGMNTIASAERAIAGGNSSQATANNAVALNSNTKASGVDSMAINNGTVTKAKRTFAAGLKTIAASIHQFVFGTFNIEDGNDKYVHIIGNGTSESNRSNAHTVDWNGNGWYSGDVYVGGTSQYDAKKLCEGNSVEELSINWTGNIDSDDVYVEISSYLYFVKVSDKTPLSSDWTDDNYIKEKVINGNIIALDSINIYRYDGAWGVSDKTSVNEMSDLRLIVIMSENANVLGYTFTEKGIYFKYVPAMSIDYSAKYTSNLYMSSVTGMARIKETLISDIVKMTLSDSIYMTDEEKQAIRDALGITELIEALQAQTETE